MREKLTLQNYRTEYEQANALYRHYQRIQVVAASLFVLAFVILALTWETAQLYLLLLLCLLSVAVFLIWFILNIRYTRSTSLVSKKIYELEEILGLSLHRGIRVVQNSNKSKNEMREQGFYLPEISLIILIILWIVRLFLAVIK